MEFVHTVVEWCRAHKVSKSKFYELKKAGLAPKVIYVGRKPLITVEASAEWRRQMESQGDANADACGRDGTK